jgi:hypothetical protein
LSDKEGTLKVSSSDRLDYATEIEKTAMPLWLEGASYMKVSSDWAMLAIKNAFIANAGGAGVLPILQKLVGESSATVPHNFNYSLMLFALGIAFAAVASAAAYMSYQALGADRQNDAVARMNSLAAFYYKQELSKVKTDAFEARMARWSTWTTAIALTAGIASYLFFLAGIFVAVNGAQVLADLIGA